MVKAFLGLGSNLDSPRQQIQRAVAALKQTDGITVETLSPLYHSKPVGPQNQPNYLNAVVELTTKLAPLDLLRTVQAIENIQGRERHEKWGARTLDIDLLLYDDWVIDTVQLTVPHPEMCRRAFVLRPLADLAPHFCLPDNSTVLEQLRNLPPKALESLTLLNKNAT